MDGYSCELDSTTVEKLDALSWLNINALDQFPDEFRIQLAWLRQYATGYRQSRRGRSRPGFVR